MDMPVNLEQVLIIIASDFRGRSCQPDCNTYNICLKEYTLEKNHLFAIVPNLTNRLQNSQSNGKCCMISNKIITPNNVLLLQKDLTIVNVKDFDSGTI